MPGHQGDHGADRVRGLGRHVHRELAFDRLPARDAAAGLDGSDVNAGNVELLLHDDVGVVEGLVGFRLVSRLPVPDVVRFLVVAHFRRALRQGLERIHDHRQRLVLDFDGGDAVGRRVAARGHDRRDLLGLVLHGVDRKHHLLVGHQGRHPGEAVLVQVLARDHRGDARRRQRFRRIDLDDLRVGVGTSDDVEVQHSRKLDVVDVVSLAADETRVFLTANGVSEPATFNHWILPSSSPRRTARLSRC